MFQVGEANFYTTYKKRKAIDKIEKEIARDGTLFVTSESGS